MRGRHWVWVHLMGEKKVFHPGRQEGRQTGQASRPSSALRKDGLGSAVASWTSVSLWAQWGVGLIGQRWPVNGLYLGNTFRSFHLKIWVSRRSDLGPNSLLDLQGGSCCPWACTLWLLIDKRFSTRGDYTTQGTSGNVWTFVTFTTGGQEVLLASSGYRPRILLNFQQCTG